MRKFLSQVEVFLDSSTIATNLKTPFFALFLFAAFEGKLYLKDSSQSNVARDLTRLA